MMEKRSVSDNKSSFKKTKYNGKWKISKIKVMIIIKYHRHRHLDLFCFEFYISCLHPEHEIYAVFVNLEINRKGIYWIRKYNHRPYVMPELQNVLFSSFIFYLSSIML
jgi:hypothetical protein